MEMDQISLQTLDRASIDIRRTLLHLSDLLILPQSLLRSRHTHMGAKPVNLRLSFIYYPPNPVSRAHVCDVPLENSPVTRIHQDSAKYRELLLLMFAAWVWVRHGAHTQRCWECERTFTISCTRLYISVIILLEPVGAQNTVLGFFVNSVVFSICFFP